MSLTSGESPGCARAYLVQPAAGVTRISLAISFEGEVRDGVLLTLSAAGVVMSLSVAAGAARLRWACGDTLCEIRHPTVLKAAMDDSDHLALSYKIDIER